MKILRKGDKGPDVRTLQAYLNLIQDGIFGVLTEEAVKAFQTKNDLKADGIVGPITWKMLALKETIKKSKRKITKLILHCSATPEGKDYSVETIRKWHTDPKPKGQGWSDIGYHYVVYRDGTVHEGRDVDIIGAHTSGYNTNSIGICYIGGVDANGKTKDTRTAEQKTSLVKLVKELMEKYGLTPDNVYGHYQFAIKDCPSFSIMPFRKELT